MSENVEKLIMVLSKVLEVKPESITDETSPENTPSWDSFNGLLLVSELEEVFSVHFSMEEVYAVTKVKDIKEALSRHNVSFE